MHCDKTYNVFKLTCIKNANELSEMINEVEWLAAAVRLCASFMKGAVCSALSSTHRLSEWLCRGSGRSFHASLPRRGKAFPASTSVL